MRIRMIAACVLLLGVPHAFGQAATRPFTIGPDTTIVEGPLNTDGTINYVAAINAILSKGITKENNAAIPFLQATTNARTRDTITPTLKELGITLPADGVALISLNDYVAAQRGKPVTPEESDALDDDLQKCMSTPWKSTDFPKIAGWLKQEAGLTLLEKACDLPHCYLPWVGKSSPPFWLDSMPPLAPFRSSSQMLAARAMLRAGNADVTGALDDLRRVQILARHVGEERTFLSTLVSVAIDFIAMRGYDALASRGGLTPEQLKTLRLQIAAGPALPSPVNTLPIEEMLALDCVMACIRGDAARVISTQAGEIKPDLNYDLGDLPRTNWDALLKAIRHEYVVERDMDTLPFAQRMKKFDEETKIAIDSGIPGSVFFAADGQKTGKEACEAYLKLRAGETPDQFAVRMAHWWVSGNPDFDKRFYMLIERARLERELAPVVISLAEFHAAHGAYPDSLVPLGTPIPQDPFSGKEIIYRREGAGYILYSVGLNQKDDNGAGDDRPIKTEK